MQHETLLNGEKDRLRLNKAMSELLLQLDWATTQPIPEDATQLAPEDTGMVGGRRKTMNASGPGSEYWLP